MAVTYYGIDRSGQIFSADDVTKDTSTTSSDIELAVDDSNSPTKFDVELALEAIKAKIMKDGYP